MAKKYVEVDFDLFKTETSKAALFIIDDEEVWIPWSQIEEGQNLQTGRVNGRVSVTEWIAKEKQLEYIE